jgi:virginiamycin B lyase
MIVIALSFSMYYYFLSNSSSIVYTSKAEHSTFTTEYPLNSKESSPNAIVVDAKGNVWFGVENGSNIGELNPASGVIHEYPIPTLSHVSITTWGIAIDNSRNLLWFTEQVSNAVWSFSLTNHTFKEYVLKTPKALPFGITIDSKGNVWFTELFGNKIGKIAVSGNLSEYSMPVSGRAEPSAITVDSTGKVWFALPGINSTGSYYNGKFTIYSLQGLVEYSVGIAVDSQGNLWMTQHGPSFIIEYNPVTHYARTISSSIPPAGTSLPYFINVDRNGNVWFNEHYGNAMAEFIPSTNSLVEYFIPTREPVLGNISGMITSTLSSNGEPWYTEFYSGKIGTINTSVPLNLNLSVLNDSNSVTDIPNGTSVTFKLLVSGSNAANAKLSASVGNFTHSFSFTFSSNNAISILNDGAKSGVYFVTISALTSSIGYSKVIEVRVP